MLAAANGPSPASIFLQHGSQTPGAFHAHLQQAVVQPVLPGQTMSQAGSAISSSLATSADAPNEARKLIRLLLESEGQGRLSLARLQAEFQTLSGDMYASKCITHPARAECRMQRQRLHSDPFEQRCGPRRGSPSYTGGAANPARKDRLGRSQSRSDRLYECTGRLWLHGKQCAGGLQNQAAYQRWS